MRIKWHGLTLATFVVASCTWVFAQAPAQEQGARGQGGAAAGQRGGGGGGRGGGGGGRGGGGAAEAAQPVPRWPNGRPRLGAEPGKPAAGLWHGAFGISGTNIPYQPWARAVAEVRQQEKLEPHARCKPSGAVRQFQTPYGVDIVELPEQNLVYFMDVGGPHTFRVIYTDGRQHPKDFTPTYYGHSIGHWEGDTFVIDTVGYNEKFWIDRGDSPNTGFVHTTQARTIERLTRTNFNTIRYELTIDDPGAYTQPWTANTYNISLRAEEELFEYICQDNNQGAELMVGTMGEVDRRTLIIP
jgi:hypothetical protein